MNGNRFYMEGGFHCSKKFLESTRALPFLLFVPRFHSVGHRSGDLVYWICEANRFEFTMNEFQEIIQAIQRRGLFAYLLKERPALHAQLMEIARMAADDLDDSEIEFQFEQSLLNLNNRL